MTRVRKAVFGCNLKNNRMISLRFQSKRFNITVIHIYVPISNAREAEVERLYEDLQDLLELTSQNDALFIKGDWNAKVGSRETPEVTGTSGWTWSTKQSRSKANRILPRERTGHSKHHLPTRQEKHEHPTLSNIDHMGKIQAMKQLRSLSQMLM